jgi:hypothetical protein
VRAATSRHSAAGSLVLTIRPYVARFQLDGPAHEVNVLQFCEAAFGILQRFIDTFDQAY